MAQPEFEEKDYEHRLNIELWARNSSLWTPERVFQNYFGIDATLITVDQRLWKLYGLKYIISSSILQGFRWDDIWKRTAKKRLPTFKTNLLLQIKRPQYKVRKEALYASRGIAGHYWQFEKTNHQQEALEKLHHKLSGRTLVCYVSPAFHTSDDIDEYFKKRTIVANSTFVQIHKMRNHDKWVYDNPGTIGLACSIIKKVKDKEFWELVSELSEQTRNALTNDPLKNLLALEKSAIQIMNQLGENNPIAKEFKKRRRTITKIMNDENELERGDAIEATTAYLTFYTFCNLTNTMWYAIGG